MTNKSETAVIYHDELNQVTVERFDGKIGVFNLLSEMYIERGDAEDWNCLSALHYKAHKVPAGSRIYRCRLGNETIGVCTLGYPRLTLRARRFVMPNLKTGSRLNGFTKLVNSERAKWLNANMRVNGRVVVDTMFRGAGIAYRMQNLAFRMESINYVEFQSSMSKYNKFAEKSGIVMTKPQRGSIYEKGMDFFRTHIECHPADYEAVTAEVEGMSKYLKVKVDAAIRKFYCIHSSIENAGVGGNIKAAKKIAAMPLNEVIKNLQQLVFASPLYGIYENPDSGRKLPDRIPLLAFDNQATNEPLKLELL